MTRSFLRDLKLDGRIAMEIEGKRVLVTGASRGLGRALSLACLGAGAREVLAGARHPESLENLRETAQDVRLTPVHLDVTSEDEVRAAADFGHSGYPRRKN